MNSEVRVSGGGRLLTTVFIARCTARILEEFE